MSGRHATYAAVFAAMLIFLAPFLRKEFSATNAPYDSVFASSPGALPCMKAGRIMPLSSAAADSLKLIAGKTSVKIGGEKTFSTKWLFALSANPKPVSGEAFMRSDNKELVKFLGGEGRYFSYENISGKRARLYRAAVGGNAGAKASAEALNALNMYELAASALAVRLGENMGAAESLAAWRMALKEASKELDAAKRENRKPDTEKLSKANSYFKLLWAIKGREDRNPNEQIRTIPHNGTFITTAAAMLEKNLDEAGEYALKSYAVMCDSIAEGNTPAALEKARRLYGALAELPTLDVFRLRAEHIANAVDPFFGGFLLYCAALLLFGAASLSKKKSAPLKFGGIFLCAGALAQCAGIAARMYIQARPPVTNLYSSVVFAGAVAALMGIALYMRKKNIAAAFAACVAGLLSLLVAVNLPYGGDTMGMMRAVLNSNFWLTSHVMTIMTGYGGVFLAGFLASAHIAAHALSKTPQKRSAKNGAGAVCKILCAALFFCFLGTMLGGVWADMSWGRFWGWDPKENGALMTLLWCAAAIHCRLLRVCSDRTFFAMAAFGNVVAAWGWFGVNLLGIGLHSYGFIDGGWLWFGLFAALQTAVALLAFAGRRGIEDTETPGKQ